MLITRQIPALWNGVSQQPDPVRLPSQAEEQINCWSSVVEGVSKRNPSEHIAVMPAGSVNEGALMHVIDRDVTERYVVVMDGTRIRVFGLDGTEKTVTAPLGWGYLALEPGVSPRNGYVAMTVADYTFILNKTKKVALLPVGADHDPPSAGYWWLNRKIAGSALRVTDIDEPGGGGGGTSGGGGSEPPQPPVSNPTPSPGGDSNPVGTFKGDKQTLQDLPTTGNTDGDVWRIIGSAESDFASYYVIYQAGGWYETVKPGLKNLFDALTMPHALIRQANGTFVFGPFGWSPRHVGDDKSNPHPTFVNRKIRDVFFHKNRLGFTVDENVILSRAGAFGTFHRLTVVDYLQDEAIDVAASETKVAKMEFAVPFQGSMMLFSDQTQFKLSHQDVLSGGSVSLDVTTRYPMVPGVRPSPAGSDVYFASHSSGWGKLREYFVNEDGITNDAADVSSHCPGYIPFGVHTLAATPEFDTVFVLSSGAKNKVYLYQYYWETETEKAQSAWHHWEFESTANVLAIKPLGGYLYLMVRHERAPNVFDICLERIALYNVTVGGGVDYQVHLDQRISYVPVTTPADADLYTITLPYGIGPARRADFRAINAEDGANVTIVDWVSDTQFRVRLKPERFLCGNVYTSKYTFSRQFPQNSKGESILTGRLQLKTFSVYFTNTGYFRSEVRPFGVESATIKTRQFPTQIGSVLNMGAIGSPSFGDGKATFAVQANAREASISLVNDSYLGCTFHSAEWEGFYNNRARA